MDDSQKKKLKDLKKTYGYDIAEMKQRHGLVLDTDTFAYDVLTFMELQDNIGSYVNDFLRKSLDREEALSALVVLLEVIKQELAGMLKSDEARKHLEEFARDYSNIYKGTVDDDK